ncbi:uncharacterized protein LOC134272283 [Saccostrea cucullata]|uniref:uncharacterized protein LOC134272283 n=1 Tax=Saccostrea cuccullata TaxID=36930 RepID=UPI002ED254FB
MVMDTLSFLQAIAVFVFLAHTTNLHAEFQISIGQRLNLHFGPYRIGDTYRGICDVEIFPDDNITNVDVYWKVKNTDYCHNGQKIWLNLNYTCNATTVQNTTYFELRVPDLTLEDAGTYACKVKHKIKGITSTSSENITVIDPSITTPESTTVTTLNGRDNQTTSINSRHYVVSRSSLYLILSRNQTSINYRHVVSLTSLYLILSRNQTSINSRHYVVSLTSLYLILSRNQTSINSRHYVVSLTSLYLILSRNQTSINSRHYVVSL